MQAKIWKMLEEKGELFLGWPYLCLLEVGVPEKLGFSMTLPPANQPPNSGSVPHYPHLSKDSRSVPPSTGLSSYVRAAEGNVNSHRDGDSHCTAGKPSFYFTETSSNFQCPWPNRPPSPMSVLQAGMLTSRDSRPFSFLSHPLSPVSFCTKQPLHSGPAAFSLQSQIS